MSPRTISGNSPKDSSICRSSTATPALPFTSACGFIAKTMSAKTVPAAASSSSPTTSKAWELAFWEDEIWAQTDKPLFTHGEGVLFDTRPMTDYELIIIGDAYELYVKDKLILGGALKDYSQRGLVYGIHDYLFLGDATSRGSVDIEVQFLSVTSSPLPK